MNLILNNIFWIVNPWSLKTRISNVLVFNAKINLFSSLEGFDLPKGCAVFIFLSFFYSFSSWKHKQIVKLPLKVGFCTCKKKTNHTKPKISLEVLYNNFMSRQISYYSFARTYFIRFYILLLWFVGYVYSSIFFSFLKFEKGKIKSRQKFFTPHSNYSIQF